MSNQIEQIRAEIERRIKSWEAGVKYEGDAGDCQSRVTELTDLKKFIDQLPVETVPSDVQAAAENYADEQLAGHNQALAESRHTRYFKMGYVCFAGYEMEEAFADGAKYERERLMKEAVEGTIKFDIVIPKRYAVFAEVNPKKFKPGEKVKLIILK